MLRRFFVFAFFIYGPVPVLAQEAVSDGAEITQSGEDYLRSTRRIDTEITYFDPSGPAPELQTDQSVDPEAEPNDIDITGDGIETTFNIGTLIAAAILIGIIFLFVRYGGGLQVSLRREADNASRAKSGSPAVKGSLAASKPSGLSAILNIADRREALIRLSQSALVRAVTANDILIQDSWTARDALRRLPGDQALLDDLRALVYDSERVQFGDRDVSEDSFQDHVARIRPLLAEGAA